MTLAEKYNETMNKIELSAEARQRILGNIQDMELNTRKHGKVVQLPQWKRWAALTACAAVVLFAVITLNPHTTINPIEQPGGVQIVNPFVDYETLDDAAKAAGFDLDVPETVDGYSGEKSIQVVDNRMIQILYTDDNENSLLIRKEAGSADISGDYNDYDEINTIFVGEYSVTLKGNNGTVSTAIWVNDGYSYAVNADAPISTEDMIALIAAIN